MIDETTVVDTLESCRFCLMCRHVAPVGLVTGLETVTPHGIALTATSQARGLIAWNEETVGVIYSEPDGGNCRAHCVFDLPLPAAVAAVRAQLTAQNLAPAAVYEVQGALEQWSTPFAEQAPQPATGQGDVALFVGDEAAYLWPDALPAVLHLLAAVDVEPVLIGNGRNNGLLASSLGFPETAARLARDTLQELDDCGAKTLLVLSAGDFFTLDQAYEERLGLSTAEDVRIMEISCFLADQLALGRFRLEPTVEDQPYAYVDPTHAVRNPGRHQAVRDLATAVLPGTAAELFWRAERAHPAGNTHLQFSRPELSKQLTLARLKDAQGRGAELLVCEDPGTLYELNRYAASLDLQVLGLYELLAGSLIEESF